MTCIIYAFSAYMMLFKVCKPLKSWRGVLFAAMGIGFAACIAAIPWFFNIVRLNAACVIITVLIIISVYLCKDAIEMLIAKSHTSIIRTCVNKLGIKICVRCLKYMRNL